MKLTSTAVFLMYLGALITAGNKDKWRVITLNKDTILCPPSALNTCTLAISRPLPVSPEMIRAPAYAYTYGPYCKPVGKPVELAHDGMGVLEDAPGGSIDIYGFRIAAPNVTDMNMWAVAPFRRTADEGKTLGNATTAPNPAEQGTLWTCGTVNSTSYCHITIDC